MSEFHVRDQFLVRNYTRDVWAPKKDVAYHVVHVIGSQFKLMDESGKTWKVNVLDIRIM